MQFASKSPVLRVQPTQEYIHFSREEVEQSIAARFEEQVRSYPNRLAICSDSYHWTYVELNLLSNQIARLILTQRPFGEEPIALLLDNDAPMLAAILGVLKTGKIFVPLDPTYPESRLSYMLEDSRAPIIITNPKNLHRARTLSSADCTILDIERSEGFSGENLGLSINPEVNAYILYTSGSTGQPKGIVHDQRNVLHNIMNYTNAFHLSADDRITLLHSCSFSSGMIDIFGALLNGAAVYPWNFKEKGFTHFSKWLVENEITVFNWAPTLFRHFCHTLEESDRFPQLRLIALGSEALLKTDFDLYRQHFGDHCLLVNRLGTTETNNYRMYFLNKEASLDSAIVPTGYASQDKTVILLSDDGLPVETGEVGEIVIQSQYLSSGYWGQPELTAASYSDVPNSNGERRFRTGDLGRLNADGCLEYLGRKDFQVKIRGYRIELVEIELAISAIEGIRETAVAVREDQNDDQRLVAYLVADDLNGTAGVTTGRISQLLKSKLPDYMVPSAYVWIEELPLTPSGKVDLRALPSPGPQRPDLLTPYVAPRNVDEEKLARIWAEVLRLNEVGIDDNFFELGGHSLLATQIISRIRSEFKVELQLRALFEAPTIARISERIVEAPRAVVSASVEPLLAKASFDEQMSDTIVFAQPSFAQERLWFLDQLEPDNAVYNIPALLHLSGPLDVQALEQSLNEIARRHQALRTRFESRDGQQLQIIEPFQFAPLEIVDLEALAPEEQSCTAHELAMSEAVQVFDLASGPLWRTRLLRLGTNEHHLLITLHHIVSDGWSMGILFKELTTLYKAYHRGEKSSLPDLEIEYSDFARWQREWLQGEVLQKQLSFWQSHLNPIAPNLELPNDYSRPALQTFRGGRQYLTLPSTLGEQLKTLSRDSDATLFMTLLAAYQTLLHRLGGQEEFVIGAPIAGRNRSEIELLIGFFVNTLALRADVSGEPTFLELLSRVREVALQAYEHQDLPFEKLVEAMKVERDLSRSPIFQTTFVLQNAPRAPLALDGLQVVRPDLDNLTSKFDLALEVVEKEGQLNCILEYNSDLFKAETARRWLGHFQTLLESIVQKPDLKISALPLLNPDEEEQVLAEWNNTGVPSFLEGTVPALFEAQAALSPNSVAVRSENEQLTYAELNARSNQLARHLRNHFTKHNKPQLRVGLCIERSVDMVVALLAIMKSGAAYVPLDPAFPKERLRFMAEDAQLPLIITQNSLRQSHPLFEEAGKYQLLCLDRDQKLFSKEDATNLGVGISGESLTYILYTSGSTGQPKGVPIRHFSLVNLLKSIGQHIDFSSEDVLLAVTTLSFDIAGLELFLPLISGARLVVASRDVAGDGTKLAQMLSAQSITTLQATPVTWRILQENGWNGEPHLKMLCGGEALPVDLAEWLATRGELWNVYGPTETTIWSSIYRVEQSGIAATNISGTIPIGKPLANTRFYVLAPQGQPVPTGVAGELHIGGDGLTSGYWHRDDLNQSRFVTYSFKHHPQECLYKTGDLVRYLPDGNIEFLGRLDNQVKLRGYRIELGEIESTIRQHYAVRDAVALVREDEPGHQRLVAYVVTDHQDIREELRRSLKESLPDYMVPSVFIPLDALPLTPNAKVDRKALPVPVESESWEADEFVGPRSEMESQLARLWCEALGLSTVSVRDNFFNLGGHSLLAVRLFAEIKKLTGRTLPLATLFQAPSIEQLAQILQQDNVKSSWDSLVPIRSQGSKSPLYCVHAIGGNVLGYHALSQLLGNDQPVYGLQAHTLNNNADPYNGIEEMAAHYIEEIRAIQPHGPYFLSGLSLGGGVAFAMAQQLEEMGEAVALVALFDTLGPNAKPHTLKGRFNSSWKVFKQLSPGMKLSYIRAIIKKRWKKLVSRHSNNQHIVKPESAADTPWRVALRGRNPLKSRVVLFLAKEQSIGFSYDDPKMGWGELVENIEVINVEGNHTTLIEEPHIKELASQLREFLSETSAPIAELY